ncbi:MAG TPA: epoxide hydrolase [Steroidobacteraceae bacterium]|nr:epoxide hydrolase [Steroidobacteraceae bacterium]
MDFARARPFEISVGEPILADLAVRLAATRMPPLQGPPGWDAGASPVYLRDLLAYWRSGYDWRSEESKLNRFAHFRAAINGADIHFIHERGKGAQPIPLLLTHGFPDSFTRFLKIIPMLTDPSAHGGSDDDAFDVIVPSLPWCAFSRELRHSGGLFRVHDTWHQLMTDVLGYERYGAHGGDWGSTITEHVARSHAKSVIGIHLTDVPFWHSLKTPDDLQPVEREYVEHIQRFQQEQGAYALIQGRKPQTLADGLNDSPIGLAAWLTEKFQRWSDCDGDLDACYTRDEMLTNAMVYWVTGSIGRAFMPYFDVLNAGPPRWIAEVVKQKLGSHDVPAGFAIFPKDLSHPPRVWAERFFNVQRWTEFGKGGHFAAMEQPEALVADIREFFRPLRSTQ